MEGWNASRNNAEGDQGEAAEFASGSRESTPSEASSTDALDDAAFAHEMEVRIGIRRAEPNETAGRRGTKRRRPGWMGEAEARSLRRGPIGGVLNGTAVAIARGTLTQARENSQSEQK